MHFIKKNIIIPLVVFIIGMSAVAGIVCSINNEQNKHCLLYTSDAADD